MKAVDMAYKDPVCGVHVDPKTSADESEYKGATYYFYSPGCKESFGTIQRSTSLYRTSSAVAIATSWSDG